MPNAVASRRRALPFAQRDSDLSLTGYRHANACATRAQLCYARKAPVHGALIIVPGWVAIAWLAFIAGPIRIAHLDLSKWGSIPTSPGHWQSTATGLVSFAGTSSPQGYRCGLDRFRWIPLFRFDRHDVFCVDMN
jgi:hypothetical protein